MAYIWDDISLNNKVIKCYILIQISINRNDKIAFNASLYSELLKLNFKRYYNSSAKKDFVENIPFDKEPILL